jgi:anti-sigma-K factor RskA
MHPNEDVLNELVDGTLGPAERTGTERHLASCTGCRTLVDDLRELRRAIGALELREPPARAWSRIERAIRLQADGARGFQPGDLHPRSVFTRLKASRSVWLSVAAAAIIVLAAAATLRLGLFGTHPAAPPSDASAQTGADAAQAVEMELRQASDHYEKAIKGLEQIANTEQGTLDPRTASTLQKNLAVIDQAISESRTALHTQPNSEPAQQSLIDNFKSKISLLQDTVALINEMRKGNEAGAARIVSGLKQKG